MMTPTDAKDARAPDVERLRKKLEPNGKALDVEVSSHPYDGSPVPEFQWVAARVGPLPKDADVVVLSMADAATIRAALTTRGEPVDSVECREARKPR